MDYKDILNKTIAGVAVAIIMAALVFIFNYINSEKSNVDAKLTSIIIDNPFTNGDVTAATKTIDEMLTFLGVPNREDLRNALRSQPKITLASIEIFNDSRSKSKEIEISAELGFAISSAQVGDIIAPNRNIKIRQLNPNEKIVVYAFGPWVFADPLNYVQILYDERKIDIIAVNPSGYVPFYERWITRHPLIVWYILLYIAIYSIISSQKHIRLMFHKNKVEFIAKNISPTTLRNQKIIMDYVREHYPEKMPE